MDRYQKRDSLNDYFMRICEVVATRSTCVRRKVGAVIVLDKRIVATGYNGAPIGVQNCDDAGQCLRTNDASGENLSQCWAVHAEINAIISAARHGTSVKDGTIYCTTHPCSWCAKAIVNAGIKMVYFKEEYNDPFAKEIFKRAGVNVNHV